MKTSRLVILALVAFMLFLTLSTYLPFGTVHASATQVKLSGLSLADTCNPPANCPDLTKGVLKGWSEDDWVPYQLRIDNTAGASSITVTVVIDLDYHVLHAGSDLYGIDSFASCFPDDPHVHPSYCGSGPTPSVGTVGQVLVNGGSTSVAGVIITTVGGNDVLEVSLNSITVLAHFETLVEWANHLAVSSSSSPTGDNLANNLPGISGEPSPHANGAGTWPGARIHEVAKVTGDASGTGDVPIMSPASQGSALGSISGTKYYDGNENGAQDNGEVGIPNWEIDLTDSNGFFWGSMLTDSQGHYSLSGLPDISPATYSVDEVLPNTFWVETQPGAGPPEVGYTGITVTGGSDVTGKDFGNWLKAPTPLTVTKTAEPSFTRTFTWGIDKSADPTTQNIPAGGSATFSYTVTVTHDSGTDSDWKVVGTITVHNTNPADVAVKVEDAVDNGGTCTVSSDGVNYFSSVDVTVPASSSVDVSYVCTYSSAPNPADGTNTATASWLEQQLCVGDCKLDVGSAAGSAPADFTSVTPKIIDGTVTVTDTLGGVLGTVSYSDPSPTQFPYSHTFTGDPTGACTDHKNTATFTTDTTGTTGSASQTVTVCVVPPGTVTDTTFCNLANSQFRLIYISDTSTTFTLKASNPGQFYYNVFYISGSTTPSGTTFTATIPYPFITQGAVPIQVFENKPLPACGTTVPSTNINSQFTISPTKITTASYSTQNLGSFTTVTFTLNSPLPAGNLLWFTIHLDYGLKGLDFTKLTQGGTGCLNPPNTLGDCAKLASPSLTINNPQSYTFSNSISAPATVSSTNVFKKDPGFGGLVTNSVTGNPIQGVTVKIYINNKLVATVSTDQDGFYSYVYKYTGSKISYTVTATYGANSKTVSGILSSNALIIQNFTF